MKKFLVLLMFLVPGICYGLTATVTYTDPPVESYRTVVLISEVSGDYSAGYGQISDRGANSVQIGNIKPSTQYYAVAYHLNEENVRSIYSEEYPFLTEAMSMPNVIDLPPLVVGETVLGITITITP